MKKRVVITGLGVLASNGKGKEEFWRALKEGKTGYGKVSLFDASSFNVNQVGEVRDFNAKEYMGPKGLRLLDRSTTLLVSCAKMAVADGKVDITEDNTDDIGVAVGTTMGSVKSIADFDEVTLKEGPRYTNPGLFPNTVINSPASQVSIWCNIQGFNVTISNGFTASLDALQYAYDFIQLGRAKLVLAGGVEEMCLPTFFGFHALRFLSGSKPGQPFVNCPFDKRRNGITFGEGAGLAVMEDLQHAIRRKAAILAEVAGFGNAFDPFRINKYNPRGTGVKEAIKRALDQAGLGITDIDYICANANSTRDADKSEVAAIKEVFGKQSRKIPVSSIKSMVGETFSASGALSLGAGVGALTEGFIPPTVNYKEKDPDCDLDFVVNESRPASLRHIMIVNFGPNGSNGCVILRKFNKQK